MAGGLGNANLKQRQRATKAQQKRPRSVVAWQSKAEWDQVMVGLYCSDCQTQRNALDRVSAWKSRYGPRMPLAVECTADLVRCKILDTSGVLRSHELVLTYGLALVRFVNLITEKKQKTIIIALRRLAQELNIPIWIVNLRHDLTHGNLPQLDACRRGCDVVLDWLRRNYWSRQLGNDFTEDCEEDKDGEELPVTDVKTSSESSQEEPENLLSPDSQKRQELHDKVTDVLVSYKDQQLGILQTLQDIDKTCKMWGKDSSEVEWIVAQMKDLMQENSCSMEVIVGAMLADGYLIPTVEELQVLSIDSQETKESGFRIPRAFFCFWQPLLKGLHSRDFTQTLLEKAFHELKEHRRHPELRSQYLINWIAEILQANKRAKKKSSKLKNSTRSKNRKSNSPELFRRRVSLQWSKLLDDCLAAPCWASPHLLMLILSSMEQPLPPESQEKLLYLTSIYTQEGSSLPSPGAAADLRRQPIYTVESLQLKAKQSGLARRLDKMARRRERLLGSTEEEEEEEEEEEDEEMDTEPSPLQEPFPLENPMDLAEKRAALQGSAWQVSSDGVKWKDFPLGKVPGQTDDPDGLLLDSYSTMSALDQLLNGEEKTSPRTCSSEWNSSVADGLLWTPSDLQKLKNSIQLF